MNVHGLHGLLTLPPLPVRAVDQPPRRVTGGAGGSACDPVDLARCISDSRRAGVTARCFLCSPQPVAIKLIAPAPLQPSASRAFHQNSALPTISRLEVHSRPRLAPEYTITRMNMHALCRRYILIDRAVREAEGAGAAGEMRDAGAASVAGKADFAGESRCGGCGGCWRDA